MVRRFKRWCSGALGALFFMVLFACVLAAILAAIAGYIMWSAEGINGLLSGGTVYIPVEIGA